MTWAELIYQLKGIPENRLEEKAVFGVDNNDYWEIDCIDITEGNDHTWDDLESNSIYNDGGTTADRPIVLTP